jgi:hypothetical protein
MYGFAYNSPGAPTRVAVSHEGLLPNWFKLDMYAKLLRDSLSKDKNHKEADETVQNSFMTMRHSSRIMQKVESMSVRRKESLR